MLELNKEPGENEQNGMRREFVSLATEFERVVEDGEHEESVTLATRIKRMMTNKVKLDKGDKIRVLKVINKAKVRALLLKTYEGEDIFKNLDRIGSEITKLM